MKDTYVKERALFRRALIEALAQKYDEELAACTEEATCSDAHIQSMRAIIEGHLRQVKRQKRTQRLIVLLVAAALLVLSACTVYTLRDKIRAYVETIYEDYVTVTYQDADQISENNLFDEYYTLEYVPEGYVLVENTRSQTMNRMVWSTEDNHRIFFEQCLLDSSHYLHVDQYEPAIILEEGLMIYYRQSHYPAYLWNDGIYAYKLEISETLANNEIVKLIQSVKLCE